jgi:AcrR family transcriptional regulator
MAIQVSDPPPERTPLSRDRVLNAAIAVADAGGLASLTIRSLAQELGVKPMSVYHYVANKDEILDGIVDLVFSEVEIPEVGGEWRSEMRRRASSERQVLGRHPWAIPLLQSRLNPGPSTLRHHDAVIGTLRAAGFSLELTAHAFAMIDAYVYGFALSEDALPINGPDSVADIADSMMAQYFSPDAYPHLVEFTMKHILKPGYDFGLEFEYGLNVILDGLARSLADESDVPVAAAARPRRARSQGAPPQPVQADRQRAPGRRQT